MSKQAVSNTATGTPQPVTWLYMAVIVLAQMQMAFNVNAIPVSIGPIVEELNVPATSVGTALVFYSLFVAAFVMVGAKLGKMFGERLVFQVTALLHGGAMALIALSQRAGMMNTAQALARVAAAAPVADDDGLAAQRRVLAHLDRRVEGVHVEMDDDAGRRGARHSRRLAPRPRVRLIGGGRRGRGSEMRARGGRLGKLAYRARATTVVGRGRAAIVVGAGAARKT